MKQLVIARNNELHISTLKNERPFRLSLESVINCEASVLHKQNVPKTYSRIRQVSSSGSVEEHIL